MEKEEKEILTPEEIEEIIRKLESDCSHSSNTGTERSTED
jgi:hypothetical protein